QVWCDPNKPDPSKANFPVGTVIMKMVFTMADSSQIPFLKNSMQWEVWGEKNTELPIDDKEVHVARLLEVDFAVKTNANDAVNGWVFGVFVYNGKRTAKEVKKRLMPVGLQWGNDPGITPKMVRDGEKPLVQTWLNVKAWIQEDPKRSLLQKPGWGYRLMGPVGNRATSKMSEAMTAGWPPAPSIAPSGVAMDSILYWHRNLKGGTPFMDGQVSLDYSLELRDGLRNHAIANGDKEMKTALTEEIAEALGFRPPDRTAVVIEQDDKEVIEYDEGLEGRNMFVFIGFIGLIVVIGGLLARNFMRKD
ncbi:MAG: hypothetical protein AAF570_20240, partial [Bacteroidota bacterium]